MQLERNLTQNPAPGSGNLVQPAWQAVVSLRSRRGWTQEKLAEKSILSVRTVQNIERGRSIHLGTISKVAAALGVSAIECISSPKVPLRAPAGAASEFAPCPYRGLLAFREEDANLFFGREALVDVIREKLARKNIVQVSGCSGSGKSSLVAAGLIPALKRFDSWQVLYCRPGSDPFGALASALIPHLEQDADEISRAAQIPRLRTVLEQGQLLYLLSQILRARGKGSLLLFIDQFEELYAQCNAQSVRDRFLDMLVPLGSSPRNIKLAYTIRADFSCRLLSHRRFVDEIQDTDVKIGPMNREELESVIRKPASYRNVRFEDGLAERILNDAGTEQGMLPLLEFALAELWGRQVEHTFTHSAYERIGQLSGAIALRAETLYRSLTTAQQEAARHVLTRLVRLADEGGEDTRQRVPLSALYSEDLLNNDSGRRVLTVLAEARLVTMGLESGPRQEIVEIAHEALVRRWPRLHQWLQDDRDILVWRQRLRLIIREWELTGRDDGFLLRGSLLGEARLWLSRRANDLTLDEKDFISCSLALWHRERSRQPIKRLELLVDNPGTPLIPNEQRAQAGDGRELAAEYAPFLKPGTFRLQIDVIPVPDGNKPTLVPRVPHVPFSAVASLLSTASIVALNTEDDADVHQISSAGQGVDSKMFALVRDLQMRGASGLALELLSPKLDAIPDPRVRLKFASIIIDMMHIRGRYEDAAELIRQELAMYPQNADVLSPLLIPLKIRLVHHQMFYRPVTELWSQMLDLLTNSSCTKNPEFHGEVLFMLGGNLGTLRGQYREARQFLIRATRHARERHDHYLLTRCLRKYADFLRYEGHLNLSKFALMEALRLSADGRGTRQRIYILGCLGDLERQQQNFTSASEYFERALELARSVFIPGWLGNLHLGLAALAIDRGSFDEAKVFIGQAEAHYRNTHPRHWWGEIQVALGTIRLMRSSGDPDWRERGRAVHQDATSAGYAKEAAFAASLLNGDAPRQNALMFL